MLKEDDFSEFSNKTRLISIESQPRKIVVVAVVVIGVVAVVHVVVFVQKNLGPKTIWVRKKLSQKEFWVRKKFWV